MIRNLKTLGLALVAVLALGALASATASANFDAAAEEVTLSGTQTSNHVFTTGFGTVTCKKAVFGGTQKGTKLGDGKYTSASVTQSATYSECTAFGFGATVNMNGCTYQFTITGTNPATTPTGPVHVLCPEGKKIVISAFGCNFEIGAQTPTGHVGFMNGASGTVDVASTVTGISSSGTCGTGTSGTYTGSANVKATSGAALSVTGP